MSSVLIVENNAYFRQSFCEILKMHMPSISIVETSDGREALEKVNNIQPDIIFMDIRLRDASGLELAKAIKGSHPKIVISIFTNYDLPEYRSIASRYGADHFLLKDALSGSEIAQLVRTVLTGKGEERAPLDMISNKIPCQSMM